MPRISPSFNHRRSSSEGASAVGRANRKESTKPELLLRRELWHRGLRYRLHANDLPGRPDLVFRTEKVAVFCDGDFWHGRDWAERKLKLARGTNAEYWISKIQYNIDRDRRQERELARRGWIVVRCWGGDIRSNVAAEADRVAAALGSKA